MTLTGVWAGVSAGQVPDNDSSAFIYFRAASQTGATPTLKAYNWSSTGWGAQFTNSTMFLSKGSGLWDLTISPRGDAVAASSAAGTAGVQAQAWSPAGFGAFFANPVSSSTTATQIEWSPTGDRVYMTNGLTTSDGPAWLAWSPAGWGALSVTSSGGLSGLSLAVGRRSGLNNYPGQDLIAVGPTTASAPLLYSHNGASLTAFSNGSVTAPAAAISGMAWLRREFAAELPTASGSNTLRGYSTAGSSFFNGSAPSSAATTPATVAACMVENGRYLVAMGGTVSPFIEAWPANNPTSSYGARFSNPALLPPAGVPTGGTTNLTGKRIAFTDKGTAVVITSVAVLPAFTAYPISLSGFGARYAAPVALPGLVADHAASMAFTPN